MPPHPTGWPDQPEIDLMFVVSVRTERDIEVGKHEIDSGEKVQFWCGCENMVV
jgi:hypothetical protein